MNDTRASQKRPICVKRELCIHNISLSLSLSLSLFLRFSLSLSMYIYNERISYNIYLCIYICVYMCLYRSSQQGAQAQGQGTGGLDTAKQQEGQEVSTQSSLFLNTERARTLSLSQHRARTHALSFSTQIARARSLYACMPDVNFGKCARRRWRSDRHRARASTPALAIR